MSEKNLLDMPIQIGAIEVGSRLVMPPMHTGKAAAGHVTEEMVSYYRERAKYSHPGIIVTEHSYIAEEGRASETQLSIASDEMIEEHRKLTEAIQAEGSKAFVQLNHAGSNGICEAVSASRVNIPMKALSKRPRELSEEEIRTIEVLFADAAERAVRAGYDGVEIHCAHAYLLDQFYSPMTNRRKDSYGGSRENRMRFLLEVIGSVKKRIGTDIPLAVRLGGADYLPGGATEEMAAEAGRILEQAGVSLLDISGGMCFFTRPGHAEPGYFSSMTEKIKAAVSVPVLLTGGITRLEDANRLLAEGKADLIGVGRAMLKDAHWGERL